MNTAIKTVFFSLLAIFMFVYPQEVVSSAAAGIDLWWNFVVPALLPFFILTEILMGIGFVHFIGILLEPVMRPVFGLPGRASFILALSFTSGIPSGAVLTSKMRRENLLTRIEGERLLAFTCNPSPGFMFGAVATSMMQRPDLGFILASSVYLANLLVGILFRFYRWDPSATARITTPSLKKAYHEMKKAQAQNPRPIGALLGDSIRQSINTILLIGGFIMFFTILVKLLSILQISSFLAALFQTLSTDLITWNEALALINGLLETTLGCRSVTENFPMLDKQVGALALIMGWGGLSAFAQVASFTSATDLRFFPFVVGRVLQSVLALGISQLNLGFYKIPAYKASTYLAPVGFWDSWHLSTLIFCICMLICLGLGLLQWFKLFLRP